MTLVSLRDGVLSTKCNSEATNLSSGQVIMLWWGFLPHSIYFKILLIVALTSGVTPSKRQHYRDHKDARVIKTIIPFSSRILVLAWVLFFPGLIIFVSVAIELAMPNDVHWKYSLTTEAPKNQFGHFLMLSLTQTWTFSRNTLNITLQR